MTTNDGLKPKTLEELWIKLQAVTARTTRLEEQNTKLNKEIRELKDKL